MAARREKVARWESGRTVPELSAQLAIAHIHHVPERDVLQLGWPHWLHLAAGDATLLTLPWTYRDAIDALRDGGRLTERIDHSYLAVTGPFITTLAARWKSAISLARTRDVNRISTETVNLAQARLQALQTLSETAPPALVYPAASSDLSLLTTLVSESSNDPRSAFPLLLLAGRTAALCAGISTSLGDSARAERYYLVAARAAAAADSAELSAACLGGVAYSHLLEGAPRDVLPLVDVVLATLQCPAHLLAVQLHLLAARAYSLLGEGGACLRARERAGSALTALTAAQHRRSCQLTGNLCEDRVTEPTEIAALHLGLPQRAPVRSAPLLKDSPFVHVMSVAPNNLHHVVDTQLALGDIEAAVHIAYRAVARGSSPPASVVRQYQKRFATHRDVPAVRQFLELLAVPAPI
ncbi:hypothetical protein JGB26_26730 [Streptomyces flavofungini]|uniref:Transcriptional regulator n=1 Tax=Streptomyces flavofungini TaxID=68200 RepID=A0ABS0XBR9_9ACTN|nr:hypothetical protein [Streptomyces flavofungini]MBJ3810653.1 hypothetical protein [Streptomyces flavofungini]